MSGAADGWRGWIGRKGEVHTAYYPVSEASIAYFCEAIEDANPRYYTGTAAELGGVVAPPTFVMTAIRTPTWWPGGGGPHQLLSLQVPLPITMRINVSVEQEFFEPVRPGDLLSYQSTITSIAEKRTRLGSGYFLTEEMRIWNPRGADVAKVRNTSFAYNPDTETLT